MHAVLCMDIGEYRRGGVCACRGRRGALDLFAGTVG